MNIFKIKNKTMSLSKAAVNLLAYLGIYEKTPSAYNQDISGYPYDNRTNKNWFIGTMDAGGSKGRRAASQKKGVFKTALSDLISAGY